MKKNHNYNLIFYYLLSVLIPIIVVFIGFLAGSYAPFGTKNVLSAGGYSDYLPYFYELYDRVHEGKSFVFSNTFGNGYDFTALYTFYLSDPTNLIILLFNRDSIISVLNFLYLFKVGFAGFSMFFYLNYIYSQTANKTIIDLKEESKKNNFVIGGNFIPKSGLISLFFSIKWLMMVFSVAFAISTPIITKGLNIVFLGPIAMFPLVIYGVDRLINEDTCKWFIFFMFFSFISNMYISLISLLIVFIYFFTREFESIKQFVYKTLYLIISVLLVFFLSGIIIINNIFSSFFQKNFSLGFPLSQSYNPFNIFNQMMSKSTLSSFLSSDIKVDISFGILFIFVCICYFINKNISIKTKIREFILIFFIFSGTIFSTANYILSGFSFTNINNYLYLYAFVFFVVILAFKTIITDGLSNSINIIISGVLSGLFIILTMVFSKVYSKMDSFIYTLEFLFIYFVIILIFSNKSINKYLFYLILGLVVLFELIPVSVNNITFQGKSWMSQSIENTNSMVLYETSRYIHKSEPSAHVFCVDPYSKYNTAFTNSFNEYDYIVSIDNGDIDINLELVEKYSVKNSKEASIYKNKYSLHNVYFDESIISYNYSDDYPFLSANILSDDYLKCGNVFTIVDSDFKATPTLDNSFSQFEITSTQSGVLYCKLYNISYIGYLDENSSAIITQTIPKYYNRYSSYKNRVASFDENIFDKLVKSLSLNKDVLEYNKNIKIAPINNGYLSTGFPVIRSLNYYVDDEKVKPIQFLDDNSIIPIEDTSKSIKVVYSPKYLILGALFVVLGIILIVILRNHNMKKIMVENIDRFVNNLNKYKIYIISCLLFTLCLIICFMICSSVPFGDASTVAGDGLFISYSEFVARNKEIKDGIFFPFFTFNIGGFVDVYRSTFIKEFLNPWIILKYKLLPENLYIYDFNFEFYLFSLLSVFSIIFYLTHRNLNKYSINDYKLIPIALVYSLSSYALDFYSYEAGFMYLPIMPLIILGLEQVVYKGKGWLYVCSLTFMMLGDPYHTFLLCEFLCLYYLTFNFKSVSNFVRSTVRFACFSFCSAGLAAFTLLPFYYSIADSPYLAEDKKPSIFTFFASFAKVLSDIRIGYSLGVVTKDNSKASIYCGLLIILGAIPLYILCKSIDKRTKIKKIALLILLFISFNNELLNYVFHGFHFQTLVPNRFAIFFVFLIITIFADAAYYLTNNMKKLHSVVMLLTILLFSVLLYINLALDISFIITFVFLTLYSSTIIVCLLKKKNWINILLFITCIEIFINSFIIFPKNNGEVGDTYISKEIDIITNQNPDMKSFDKNTQCLGGGTSLVNIGNTSNINSLSYFSNLLDMNVVNRLFYYNLRAGSNSFFYKGGNPLADMMLRVKYQIEDRYDTTAYSVYNKKTSYNNLVVYENPYCIPLGIDLEMFDKKKYNDLMNDDGIISGLDYQNNISKALGGDDIYDIIDLESVDDAQDDNYYIINNKYDVDEVNSNDTSFTSLTIHLGDIESGKIYASVQSSIYLIGEVTEDNKDVYIDYPSTVFTEDYKPSIGVLNEKNFEQLYNRITTSPMYDYHEDSHSIYGKVDAKESGLMYISLTYNNSWDIYVDGELTEYEDILGGIGFPISKGYHNIKMVYRPKGAIFGALITLITIFILVTYGVLRFRKIAKFDL